MIAKRKLFYRLLVLSLLLALALSSVGAAAPAEDGQAEELGLNKAINLALANNPQMELSRISVEQAELAKTKAEKQAEGIEDAKDSGLPLADVYYNYQGAQGQYVAPRKGEMDVLLSSNTARAQEDGLKMTVEKLYYDVLKFQASLTNKQSALGRATENLRLAETKLEAGTVPKTDVMQAEVDKASAEVAVSSAENNLELVWLKLNEAMGQPLDQAWVLSDSFNFEPQELDLQVAIAQAKAKDLQLLGYQEGVAVAAVDFEQAKKYYTPNVYTYREAEYRYREALLNVKQTDVKLELKVREAYSNLTASEKNYRVLEQKLEVMRENARLAGLQYEVGMITQFQLRQINDGLNDLEAALNEMLYNYNLLAAQFKYSIFDLPSGSVAGMATAESQGF